MRELRLSSMSDVYKHIQTSLEELNAGDFNLLTWFLKNWKHVGEEYTSLYSYNHCYARYRMFEKGVDIAKIPTPWGNCVKVRTWQCDRALFHPCNDRLEQKEVIFLFAEED